MSHRGSRGCLKADTFSFINTLKPCKTKNSKTYDKAKSSQKGKSTIKEPTAVGSSFKADWVQAQAAGCSRDLQRSTAGRDGGVSTASDEPEEQIETLSKEHLMFHLSKV